jgi:hypothetical protein
MSCRLGIYGECVHGSFVVDACKNRRLLCLRKSNSHPHHTRHLSCKLSYCSCVLYLARTSKSIIISPPCTLTTTPITPILPVIVTTMRLSRPIPDEIWEGIMSHLEDDRQTLKAVMLADCLASSAAMRMYWQNTLACKGLLTELEEQPQNEQQFLASLIHAVVINFKLPYDEHEGRGLCFPVMRSLTIEHNPALIGRHGRVYARTKHLVGSCWSSSASP